MKLIDQVKNLALKEREVRQLEMLIERITSLNDEDLAKVLAGLAWSRKGLAPQDSASPLSRSDPQGHSSAEQRRIP